MPPGAGIDVLPDEVLHHILGLLEAHESVRTCVLARRWRHLWKSATGQRVVAGEGEFLGSMEKFCDFMDSLPRHHPASPLQLRLTSFGPWMSDILCEDEDRLLHLINAWFWRAVRCQVRVLRLRACYRTGLVTYEPSLAIGERPVDSQHLTRLELDGIVVNRRLLDFSSCPLLEHLEFRNCHFPDDDSRLRICAPSLVSLLLDGIWGVTPMLESMPSLVKAVVAAEDCWIYCYKSNCRCEFCGNSYSIGNDTGSNGSVLLKGLSEAKDLALISDRETIIFKKDLRWCPIFSKLKTLLLNEYWCVPDDFRALVCILEHSPVLEKLTLELSSEEDRQQRERKGTLRPMEGSAAILEHLKIIEIRCDAVDERICKLTLFLCAFHIRLSLN
ncbi:unnamed protein product [Urochloa decumbens]|uniref:F-box domain-containing protein n=1 Tax=Urochloa decumbens TaxID=240449 RepID=A0ABC8VW18_9POAL